MSLKKAGSRDLQVLIDFTKPDPKTVAFRGRKAEIFYPKLKIVQEYDLGKRTDLIDQFLLVGFGTTGKELKANYSMRYVGEESVAGQKAYKLELILSPPPAVTNCKSWNFGSMMTGLSGSAEIYPALRRLLPVYLPGREIEPPIRG